MSKVRASVCLSPTFVRCAVIFPHIIMCFPGTSTQNVTLPADCRVPSFFIFLFLCLLMCRLYTCTPALRRVDEQCICDSSVFFFFSLSVFSQKYIFNQNKVLESQIRNKCASLIVFSREKLPVGDFLGSAETEKVECALILILRIHLSLPLCTII